MGPRFARATTFCLAALLANSLQAGAQDFYKGKQIRLIIGSPVGNDYDLAGRFLARYLAKHIPGEPTIVVQNMPQAQHRRRQLPRGAGAAGRDGVRIVLAQCAEPGAAWPDQRPRPDPRRFNFIGATSLPSRVCVRWVTAPVKTAGRSLHAGIHRCRRGRGIFAEHSADGCSTGLLGTKFRIIQGYKGTTDAVLAMERGEIQGLLLDLWTIPALRAAHPRRQARLPHPRGGSDDSGNSRRAVDLRLCENRGAARAHAFRLFQHRVWTALCLPPDVPKDRVEIMRKAFAETLQDPALQAEPRR